jgi:hypothetical protein
MTTGCDAMRCHRSAVDGRLASGLVSARTHHDWQLAFELDVGPLRHVWTVEGRLDVVRYVDCVQLPLWCDSWCDAVYTRIRRERHPVRISQVAAQERSQERARQELAFSIDACVDTASGSSWYCRGWLRGQLLPLLLPALAERAMRYTIFSTELFLPVACMQ